jgi:sporulation protein YunB
MRRLRFTLRSIRRKNPSIGSKPGSSSGLPKKWVVWLVIILLLFSFGYGFYRFDRRVVPLVLAATELRLKTTINNAIYSVVQEIIAERGVLSDDFYIYAREPDGSGPVLAVNTVLVNDICNAAALGISQQLHEMEPEVVSVPLGMALGLDTLAQMGPKFTFKLVPTGNAQVNYESSFKATGINQAHFEVWLTVVSTIRIINPVQSATVVVARDVSLVDTVISGVVPDTYFNVGEKLFGIQTP